MYRQGVSDFKYYVGISSLAQLQVAAREHQLRALPGFGEKLEEGILREV